MEDTAEATIRAYEIVSLLPNEQQNPEDFEPQDLDDPGDYSEEELMDLIQKLQGAQSQEPQGQGEEEESYESPQEVEFRGDFKPELVQLLNKLRMDGSEGDGQGSPSPRRCWRSCSRRILSWR